MSLKKYRVKNGPSSKRGTAEKTPGESPARKRSKNDAVGQNKSRYA
jgi:hypothetical protein